MSADETRALATMARRAHQLIGELNLKRQRLDEISNDRTGFPKRMKPTWFPPMRVWREGEQRPPQPEPPPEVKAWEAEWAAAERQREARKDVVVGEYRTLTAELETYREPLARACARSDKLKSSEFRERLTLVTATVHTQVWLGFPDHFALLQFMLTDLADWLDAKADDEDRADAAVETDATEPEPSQRFVVPLIAPSWRYDVDTLADAAIRIAFTTIAAALHDALRICESVARGIRPEPNASLRMVVAPTLRKPTRAKYNDGDVFIFGLIDGLGEKMTAARLALKPLHSRFVCTRDSPPPSAFGKTGPCAHAVAVDIVERVVSICTTADFHVAGGHQGDLGARWDIIHHLVQGLASVDGRMIVDEMWYEAARACGEKPKSADASPTPAATKGLPPRNNAPTKRSPPMSKADMAAVLGLADARAVNKSLRSADLRKAPGFEQKFTVDLDLVTSADWRERLKNFKPKRREVEPSSTKQSQARK
jgi:hypothetical protein